MKKNAFYAQSGGVTSVINVTAAAVIQEAKKFPNQINKVYAGQNGILGALRENLIDTSKESKRLIESNRMAREPNRYESNRPIATFLKEASMLYNVASFSHF